MAIVHRDALYEKRARLAARLELVDALIALRADAYAPARMPVFSEADLSEASLFQERWERLAEWVLGDPAQRLAQHGARLDELWRELERRFPLHRREAHVPRVDVSLLTRIEARRALYHRCDLLEFFRRQKHWALPVVERRQRHIVASCFVRLVSLGAARVIVDKLLPLLDDETRRLCAERIGQTGNEVGLVAARVADLPPGRDQSGESI